MSQPYDPEQREEKVGLLASMAVRRVLFEGDAPRQAVEDVAEVGDSGLIEYGSGEREDAIAHVEQVTVAYLEAVAERLAEVDVEGGGRS